jgi:predicted ArsR family transcriptional regulator
MDSPVLIHDLTLDAMAKRMDHSRRTIQVLMLIAHYGELTTDQIADMLDITIKTLRNSHLPRLQKDHWIKSTKLLNAPLGDEKWKMEAVKRKRVGFYYASAEVQVKDRLKKFRHLHYPIVPKGPVPLGSME